MSSVFAYTQVVSPQASPAPAPRPVPAAGPAPVPPRPPCITLINHLRQTLPLRSLRVVVECQIVTAFVQIEAVFVNTTAVESPSGCLLIVPMNKESVVSQAEVRIAERLFETMVVPQEEAKLYHTEYGMYPQVAEHDTYSPNVFRIPFGGIVSGCEVYARVLYHERLDYYDGMFSLTVPLTIPEQMLLQPAPVNAFTTIECIINTPLHTCEWGSYSHPLVARPAQMAKHVELEADRNVVWTNTDFHVCYSLVTDKITGALIVQPPRLDGFDDHGTFCLFVAPPTQTAGLERHARTVVFVLDRSLSMSGVPFEDMRQAVMACLDRLTPYDCFNLIAVADLPEPFLPAPMPVTPDLVWTAKQWLSNMETKPGTNLLAAMQLATNQLLASWGVPYIFLITDGSVANERAICAAYVDTMVAALGATAVTGGRVRVNTLGIGPFVNPQFLRLLSRISRGSFDHVFDPQQAGPALLRMFVATELPLLTDVALVMPQSPHEFQCELYPRPIPDLYAGRPIVVTGRYRGTFPDDVELVGYKPGGGDFRLDIRTEHNFSLPLDKVFARDIIEATVSKAWALAASDLRQLAVSMAVFEGVPSAFSTMVVYETTPARSAEWRRQPAAARKRTNESTNAMPVARSLMAPGSIVYLVAAAPVMFGDLAATESQALISGFVGAIAGVAGLGVATTDGTPLSFGAQRLPGSAIDFGQFISNMHVAYSARQLDTPVPKYSGRSRSTYYYGDYYYCDCYPFYFGNGCCGTGSTNSGCCVCGDCLRTSCECDCLQGACNCWGSSCEGCGLCENLCDSCGACCGDCCGGCGNLFVNCFSGLGGCCAKMVDCCSGCCSGDGCDICDACGSFCDCCDHGCPC